MGGGGGKISDNCTAPVACLAALRSSRSRPGSRCLRTGALEKINRRVFTTPFLYVLGRVHHVFVDQDGLRRCVPRKCLPVADIIAVVCRTVCVRHTPAAANRRSSTSTTRRSSSRTRSIRSSKARRLPSPFDVAFPTLMSSAIAGPLIVVVYVERTKSSGKT